MVEIKVGQRWRTHRGSVGVVKVDEGPYIQMLFEKDDPNHSSGGYHREHFKGGHQPWTLVEDTPDSRDVRIAELERDLKIAREWNVKHLATIAQRPDAWTWGKCQEERDSARQALVGAQLERDALRKECDDLRAALAETDAKWHKAEANAEEQEALASLERLRASKARELEAQVETLKHDLALQVKARQEAQDAFVAEARARKYAEEQRDERVRDLADARRENQSLRAQVEASKEERRGKVERQREEIARLNAEVQHQKNVAWATEKKSDSEIVRLKGERDAVRSEVGRLHAAITKLAGHGDPAVTRERDEARKCLSAIADLMQSSHNSGREEAICRLLSSVRS